MTTAVQYLEAAKLEEIAADFEAQGYKVTKGWRDQDVVYDLVAKGGDGKKIAVEVKARTQLRTSAAQVSRLREKALQSGFEEFRLVVVNPPHETDVEIEGLANILLDYLAQNTPTQLRELAKSVKLRRVDSIDVGAVQMTKGFIRVTGDGVLGVTLISGGELDWDLPISFDVWLDNDLQLQNTPQITVDYSSYLDQSNFMEQAGLS